MPSIELTDLLYQVLTSWQVLAITGAIIVYLYLVIYVARTYHRPRMASRHKPKKAKKEKAAAPVSTDDELLSEG
jgi:type VI protein secretion system component VasK